MSNPKRPKVLKDEIEEIEKRNTSKAKVEEKEEEVEEEKIDLTAEYQLKYPPFLYPTRLNKGETIRIMFLREPRTIKMKYRNKGTVYDVILYHSDGTEEERTLVPNVFLENILTQAWKDGKIGVGTKVDITALGKRGSMYLFKVEKIVEKKK